MAIEGDRMFTLYKYLLIVILAFDFLCIHFSFLTEVLVGAPGDVLTFGVYFTFTIILFAALFFAVWIEHQFALMATIAGLILNALLLPFIPIHILAVTFYVILVIDLGCFIYVLQRGGMAAVLNQP